MGPATIGFIVGIALFVLGAAYRAGRQDAEARAARAEEIRKAAIEEGQANHPEPEQLPQQKNYSPKGKSMPKPVFLPTPAESLLEEDPVIEWKPVAVIEDGVLDWDSTDANAVYANPKTGELIEYGHK